MTIGRSSEVDLPVRDAPQLSKRKTFVRMSRQINDMYCRSSAAADLWQLSTPSGLLSR
jgi:hypothetical protein